ncbi:MAG: outer-membrane lipoprotein carrier protein LolA [Pyrinomonadaceae bacterium]|nr:outer-membrane lipoprotein carrier protein LolA [Pyrinomonadaceae bacterium]
MKNSFKYLFTAIFAFAIFGAFIYVKAQGQETYVRALYGKMETNQKTLKSLRANVIVSKYNSQLRSMDEPQKGTLIFVPTSNRKANFKIDWVAPQQETLAVNNGKYVLKRSSGDYVEGNADSAAKKNNSGALEFVYMSTAELRQKYSAEWKGGELIAGNSISAFHLVLTPKTPSSYKQADIWVDESGMPVQFKASDRNGDETTILLTGIQKNDKINPKDLKIEIPKGAKRIKG